MNYIGEFQKDSTILLELLTKDEENQPIATDYPPTATIEHYDRNGLHVVDNVTLETMGDKSRHTKVYEIPSHWPYGDYIITYRVMIEGLEYTTQEKFYISRTEELVEENNQVGYEILEMMKSAYAPVEEEPEEKEEPATSAKGYIMPPDFQTASTIEVVDNRIIVTLAEPMKYNESYMVVLDKNIRSLDGKRLGETKTISFTSEYKPLLATPMEVQSIVKGVYKYFSTHDVYAAIRDAGQKAFQYLGRQADPNNSRYREHTARETTYFETCKYVVYEASRTLLASLMIRILNGGSDDDDLLLGEETQTTIGGSIKLGDFSVSDTSSSSTGLGGSNSKNEETQLQKLTLLIEKVEKELKFWQDAMMGRNRRGYARPVSSSFRTAAGSPQGRDLE